MQRLTLTCLLVVSLSACGGGGSIALENLETESTKALCAYLLRCGVLTEDTDCNAFLADSSNFEQYQASVKAGRVRYDGVAASDCLAILAASDCTRSGFPSSYAARCDQAFTGTVALGAPCVLDDECASRECGMQECDDATQCCRGTCIASIPLGGNCTGAFDRCVAGTFCTEDATPGTSTCTAPVGEGLPCPSYDCEVSLVCAGAPAAERVCLRPPKRGEACVPGAPCDSLRDTCAPATSRCVERGAVGAACVEENDCLEYATCAPTTKTCVVKVRPAVGDPCGPNGECDASFICQGGICAARPPTPVCSPTP